MGGTVTAISKEEITNIHTFFPGDCRFRDLNIEGWIILKIKI
jgi:hypothetical protein